jgi:hypothetical protein
MKKIEQLELDQITKANTEFTELKETIANIEVQKHQALHRMSALQAEFKDLEAKLIEKYGENVTINTKTGEIIEQEENGNNT